MTTCSKENEENKISEPYRFLKVKPGCKLFVRLIGQPVRMVKVSSHDRRHAIIESEDVGQLLREKYPQKLSRVYERYACWCIDRDDNTMKILDMPASVFIAFANT